MLTPAEVRDYSIFRTGIISDDFRFSHFTVVSPDRRLHMDAKAAELEYRNSRDAVTFEAQLMSSKVGEEQISAILRSPA